MDSTESRWVFQDEDDSEIEDDDEYDNPSYRPGAAAGLDSEDDEDNAGHRLIRTGPRLDSFDVEALEVPGAHRNEYEVASEVLTKCASSPFGSTSNDCVFNFSLFRSIHSQSLRQEELDFEFYA